MNIAFLFNSDHDDYGSWYGLHVLESMLDTRVLQSVHRNMRVSIGDILTYGIASTSNTPTYDYLEELDSTVYQPHYFDKLIPDRLKPTFGKATVYCWVFQNMTAEIAENQHLGLIKHRPYLGAMDVTFEVPLSLHLFRNSLIESYRFFGNECSIFHDFGENVDPDTAVVEKMESSGFSVNFEDMGARKSVFDKYNTVDHFRRIGDFRRIFSEMSLVKDDDLSNLIHSLEELHPKLFDAFASAARALERAETEEDLAQAALSGRRLLEQTADYLFPAQTTKWNGREVGRAQYKNRLWAYIDTTLNKVAPGDTARLRSLGTETDRLVSLFNAGLHSEANKEKVSASFRDLVIWLAQVIDISPAHMRRPYLAYEERISQFVADVTDPNTKQQT